MAIRCAEILLGEGHEVRAVASSDTETIRWARENKITQLVPGVRLGEQIDRPFDYLFSIVNEHILGDDVLSRPRRLAINYHDAPLPAYAGTHATSWALMNGETVHGVTWHVITDVVDAGDILAQEMVQISDSDTALTLNTKCFEAAIKSFRKLVEELSSRTVVARRQDLGKRTFFARYKRPARGGLISWNDRANEISALVRALQFGNHPNPLGVPKLAIKDDFFIVSRLEIQDTPSLSTPGTINEIGEDFMRISSADQEVLLREMTALDGQAVPIGALAARFDLQVGGELAGVSPETAKRAEALYKGTCKHESFWAEKLSSMEPIAPPYVDSTVTSESPAYQYCEIRIPDDVWSFLDRPGNNWDSRGLILAAFGTMLARLGGTDEFDVGYCTPEIRREIAGLDGLFAAQIPFRFTIDCRQTFTPLFGALEAESELVRFHKSYPLDLVARQPRIRSTGEKFVLPVVFAEVERFDDYAPISGNELTLLFARGEDGCRWIYDRNRLDPESIDKLTVHFITFLKNLALDAEVQIADVPLLTPEERHRILYEWNDNRLEYPKDKCIHQLFEDQARRTPGAIALICHDSRLTYEDLNRRADQLARHLKTFGVGPESLVGICADRSVELIVGILGILKAGGAYVPLDPAYPKDRLEFMLEDSRASVLLTQRNLADRLSFNPSGCVFLDGDWKNAVCESDRSPVPTAKPNNLAYVIYTSGSTGRPKGVAIEHRNAVAFLSWANSVFSAEQLKCTVASTSVCFDLSVFEVFAPLSCGGTVLLVENILRLPTAPAANQATLINTVPSAIVELLRIKGIPASVRTVNLAGELLKTSIVRQLLETGTVREVFDLYGPSEDTTYSTFTLRDLGTANIGRPISNTSTYVLDRFLQPVPIGIPGELYLGGDGLARGYLNRPELTAERFIENPFRGDTDEQNSRLYRTGDLVRHWPTGRLEYLGRIDNQVKIRGFRIELGEIEKALLAHPEIAESVVVARENLSGDKILVAYIVSRQKQTLKVNGLRDHLKHTLPEYMVPAAFVELEEMPRTPNGKINRKALPPPAVNLSDSDASYVAQRDDLEAKLVGIWETLLGVQPIGVQNDFFELGGDSLMAVRMFAEVEKRFAKSIPLATLFEAGTIEKLANVLRQEDWASPESSIVPIQPEGTKPPFFCVHAKGGNVLFYRDLAKHLGKDQPFYGIQARRLGGRQVGHATVEEMAEFYIAEIKRIQPEGPYYLGGSSFGGLAAFEIAQQLLRRGEEVGILALFDTGTPDYPKMLPTTTVVRSTIFGFIRRIQHHRDSLRAFGAKERIDYVLGKLTKAKLHYRRKIVNKYKQLVRQYYLKTKGVGSIPGSYIQLEDQIWKAGQKYRPQAYPEKMTLFRASVQPFGIEPDKTLGWERFVAGGIEIHEVPGYHGSIVAEPYVRGLVEKLSVCLDRVQTQETRTSDGSKPDDPGKHGKAGSAAAGVTGIL